MLIATDKYHGKHHYTNFIGHEPEHGEGFVEAFWWSILYERLLQDEKWGGIEAQGNSVAEWMSILGEEYGELCAEANNYNWDKREEKIDEHKTHLREEAVQVAAVAACIVHAIDVGLL